MNKAFLSAIMILSLIGFNSVQASNFTDSLGRLTEVIPLGKTLTANLNTTTGSTWMAINNNPEIISASITNNQLVVVGKNLGVATVYACKNNGAECLKTTVTIVSQNVLGASTFELEAKSLKHAVGSWVKLINDPTVFYCHAEGLIPVPSLNIFYNNGGSLQKIQTINEQDLQENMLSIMTLSDSRVK